MCMCLATLCTVLEWMRAPLQFAWMMNIALLLTIIALLLWDILSYYGEIPFGSVLVSMVIADVLGLASASPPSNRSPAVPCRVLRPHPPCTPPCTTPCTPMHPGLHPLRTPSVTPCAKHPACSLHPAPCTLLPPPCFPPFCLQASALFLPLLAKTVLRVLYERSERREKAKIAEAERLSDTRRFVVPGSEPLPSAQPDAKPGQHMVGMLAASKNPTSMFPFIEAALRELAERHEVARHI